MAFYLKELREVNIDILDEKEKSKCLEAFNAFDKNGSKKIEKEELRKVLEGIKHILFFIDLSKKISLY